MKGMKGYEALRLMTEGGRSCEYRGFQFRLDRGTGAIVCVEGMPDFGLTEALARDSGWEAVPVNGWKTISECLKEAIGRNERRVRLIRRDRFGPLLEIDLLDAVVRYSMDLEDLCDPVWSVAE